MSPRFCAMAPVRSRMGRRLPRWMACCLALVVGMATSACATSDDGHAQPAAMEKPFAGDAAKAKRIFVFLDGTRNDAGSSTNVRRLFEAVVDTADPQTTGMYIEGVGTTETPILGAGLGLGMEARILRAYDFIAQAYRPGDAIFIVGFSRGAHQARALAGLLAYAGVPPASKDDGDARLRLYNRIIEITKKKSDSDYEQAWKDWRPGTAPPLGADIARELGLSMQAAEVAFLGVWDTVPGSSFKHFYGCREMADRRAGDRYKSGSYPPIRNIYHAVALDEKRSKFHPLLVCPPLNPAYTSVSEVWFPGAHADVGGGYADSQALSNISLQWMMAALGRTYEPPLPAARFAGDPLGLAHWSIGDWPANSLSHCEDRLPPADAIKDASVDRRARAAAVPVRVNGVVQRLSYPPRCPGK